MAIKYVSTTGSDGAGGTIGSPYLTVTHALSTMSAGDVCNCRGGTYAANLGQTPMPSGTSFSNAITVQAYLDEPVSFVTANGDANYSILDPHSGEAFMIWRNLTFDGRVSGSSFVRFAIGGNAANNFRIESCVVEYTTKSGILVHGDFWQMLDLDVHHCGSSDFHDHGIYCVGADNLIEHCFIHHNWAYGVHIYDTGSSVISRNHVRLCRIYNNGTGGVDGGGIIMTNGDDNRAYNNLIYNNAFVGAAIAQSGGSTNGRLYNNTIFGNSGLGISLGANAWDSSVINNIVFGNGGTISNLSTGSTLSNNLTADPSFYDSGSNDFHLTALSTNAIGAGVNLASYLTTDFDAVPRGAFAYDIGAYQYVTPPVDPGPSGKVLMFLK